MSQRAMPRIESNERIVFDIYHLAKRVPRQLSLAISGVNTAGIYLYM